MRASPPSPSRTKIVGDAVPFCTVLVLLCRGGRPCPPFPRHSEPVRTPAWESVSPRLPLRGRCQREALTEGEMPRVFLSPSRLRRQPPPRGGLAARQRGTAALSGRRDAVPYGWITHLPRRAGPVCPAAGYAFFGGTHGSRPTGAYPPKKTTRRPARDAARFP